MTRNSPLGSAKDAAIEGLGGMTTYGCMDVWMGVWMGVVYSVQYMYERMYV